MYYSVEILSRKTGKFGIVWTAALHVKRLNKRECLSYNIEQGCQDLIKWVPDGSTKNMKSKFSLYLLSQLMYGIVVIFRTQQDSFLAEINHLYQLLFRFKETTLDLPRNQRIAQNIDLPDPLATRGRTAMDDLFSFSPQGSSLGSSEIRSFDELDFMQSTFATPPSAELFANGDIPFVAQREDISLVEPEATQPIEVEPDIELAPWPDNQQLLDASLREPDMDAQAQTELPPQQEEREDAQQQKTPEQPTTEEPEPTVMQHELEQQQTDLSQQQIQDPEEKPRRKHKRKIPHEAEELVLEQPEDESLFKRPRPRQKKVRQLVIDEETLMSGDTLRHQQEVYKDTLIDIETQTLLCPIDIKHFKDEKLMACDQLLKPKTFLKMGGAINHLIEQQCVKPPAARLEQLEQIYAAPEPIDPEEVRQQEFEFSRDDTMPQEPGLPAEERQPSPEGPVPEVQPQASPPPAPQEEVPRPEDQELDGSLERGRRASSRIKDGLEPGGRKSSLLQPEEAVPPEPFPFAPELDERLERIEEQGETLTGEFPAPPPVPEPMRFSEPVRVGAYQFSKSQLHAEITDASDADGWTTFDTICSPHTHTRMQAAKKFSLVLDLCKNKLIQVQQSEQFGAIYLRSIA